VYAPPPRVAADTTRVGTRPPVAVAQHPADVDPSSQVMITVPPSRYHGEASTAGRLAPSHPSIAPVEQSCPSSQRFGVTQTKSGGLGESRSESS
jgi:hypothetical protein